MNPVKLSNFNFLAGKPLWQCVYVLIEIVQSCLTDRCKHLEDVVVVSSLNNDISTFVYVWCSINDEILRSFIQ